MKMTHKINYTAFMAISIDGHIAENSKSGTDWTSKEDSEFYQKSISKMDAVIVGNSTYKLSHKRNWADAIVLTSKVNSLKIKGKSVFINPKKVNLKKFLQSKNYKNVAIIGGSKVYDFCLRNKMLDVLFITIEPYVFTSGVPAFFGNDFKKYQFSLKSVKKLNKKSTILLKYEIKNNS